MSEINYDALIDCAAIKEPDGRIWTGKRHHHCISTILQATGAKPINGKQGFVTMSGRFVDRAEAYRIARDSGQVKSFIKGGELFSEDLY